MAELGDVTGGETITSAFTNNVKNRTVMRYANAAARDASIPVPVEGDMAFLQAEDLVTFYAGGTWRAVYTTFGGGVSGLIEAEAGVTGGPINADDATVYGIAATSLSTVSGNPGLIGINQTSADPNIGNATVFTASSDTNRGLQIAVDAGNSTMYVRGGTGGTWGAWVQMAPV